MTRKLDRSNPTTWNYDEAVTELKPLIAGWKKKTLEIVRLLYKANKELSHPGKRTDLASPYLSAETTSAQLRRGSGKIAQSSKPQTWEQFCTEIGLLKSTANRWLALYDPDNDKLLTADEAKDRALAIRDELFETVRKERQTDSSWCPEKWSARLERQYAVWLIEKGYDTLSFDDSALQDCLSLPDDGLYEFGLINRTYIHDIGVRATRRMTGDNAVRFDTFTSRYKSRMPAGVNPHEVMRIPELALAALEDFPIDARRQIAIITAEAFRDLALEELDQ